MTSFRAKWTPSPYFDDRPSEEVSLLVIHNISLPPGQFGSGAIADFFQGKLNTKFDPYFVQIAQMRVSAHAVIYRDGAIDQFVEFAKRAWHAGISSFQGREKCNDFSIGIELEGTDDLPYTDEQYASLVLLTQHLQLHYPLITLGRIVGHSDIAPGRKTDPGTSFDWCRFRQRL